MKERYLTVSVEQHIYRYITESLGTNVVKLERDSTLMAIIKPYLELSSEQEELPTPDGFMELKIELSELREIYNSRTGSVYYCDTLFRNVLTEKGMVKVRNFFKRTFKNSFRTFLDGYTEKQYDDIASGEVDAHRRIKVKQGVVAFLLNYHIDFDEKLINALTRDWYRHTDRNENNRFSPVLY